MNTYTKIKLTSGKNLILRDVTRITFLGAECVTGIEVNKEGDEVRPAGADERQHIIQVTLIKRTTPMKMNLKYAELEPVGPVA